jgi:hypothetical protein
MENEFRPCLLEKTSGVGVKGEIVIPLPGDEWLDSLGA